MKDKAASVKSMFAAIARRYDFLNSLLSFQQDGTWRRFAASKASIPSGGLVLDAATGTAELALRFARQNTRSTVIGLDFSYDMLLKAQAKLAASDNVATILLVSGDLLKMPFPDNTFDCVTIGFALRNVNDIPGAFREMVRVAKPGSPVISLELTRPSSFIAKAAHYLYLLYIAPYIGGLISGSRAAYTYLPESILEFPSPQEVTEIMYQEGLKNVATYRLTLGAATVHTGTKDG